VTDAFHPDLPAGTKLYRVGGDEVTDETAQSAGMRRFAAISGKTVGSEKLWMGRTHVGPAMASANHHHGESETAIYVVSGHPRFVFEENGTEVALDTRAGDYIFVPPYVAHREENPDPQEEAVVVIARSTQEAIVVNLESLSDPTR
jgi:uncharacterized RmlC-like cupin family protein